MLSDFLFCFRLLAFLGVSMYLIGLFLPRHWFGDGDKGWFSCFPREKGGKLYERVGIRQWKDKVPDMSRISRRLTKKSISEKPTPDSLLGLIRETCVAELIHELLMLLGFLCYLIRRTKRTLFWVMVWALGNLPYVMIQRYNRPRLIRLRAHLLKQKASVSDETEAVTLPKGSSS